MSQDLEALYQARLRRFVTALNNSKPDRVPILPFAAEFTGRHAGYTCQQLTQHYPDAFEAMIQCCKDYDWDAVPASMVYVWTGITDAAGVTYYGVPGVDVPANNGVQYREPPEDASFMHEGEDDRLIDDPVAFLYEVGLPRATRRIAAAGEPVTFRHNVALVSAAMAMTEYFNAFGPHSARLRSEAGMPGAIAGIFKAPFDILADKLRGYLGLTMDMFTQPAKVMKACQALMPHLYWLAVVNNVTLAFGTPEQVRQEVKTLIETVSKDGGYIMDASAIMQNDTTPENMRALFEATREFGCYDEPDVLPEPLRVAPATITRTAGVPGTTGHQPGVCVSWEEHTAELAGPIEGGEELAQRVWEAADSGGATFTWQMLVSF